MTMITASTALTIFIMNIHFCSADAKPVPRWAKVLIIDYMSKIFFVYEVGENCTSSSSSSSSSQLTQDDFSHPASSNNGQVLSKAGGGGERGPGGVVHGGHGEQKPYRHPRPQTPRPQHHPRVKKQHHPQQQQQQQQHHHHITSRAEWRDHPPAFDPAADRRLCCTAADEDRKAPCCPEDHKPPLPLHPACLPPPLLLVGPCVFCSHGDAIPGVDGKLVRNVEYIANCLREQRATCAKSAEWKKVAKVMDRFFMWVFFVMVFLMSILIMGRAP
ncbi:hypothetical protein CRUP_010303 [Coryphaenoides rupestris]|nr:hypothetical protein CRUP_010303 [Coryphaenoides rupestris]